MCRFIILCKNDFKRVSSNGFLNLIITQREVYVSLFLLFIFDHDAYRKILFDSELRIFIFTSSIK
jgi:hypothetical protein